MKRFFNIAGPCHRQKHYTVDITDRLKGIHALIEQEQFFVIHAARQSGKTTLLKELARDLERKGEHAVLYCSLESVQGFDDPEKGIPAICRSLKSNSKYHPYLSSRKPEDVDLEDINNVIRDYLTSVAQKSEKPLVLLFDEADCLGNGTLITFLRQLRDGYVNRAEIPFVHSLALTGMRNIRDYKGKIREGRKTLGSASPFNIVSEALTLRNFTLEEVKSLYGQHTQATGQEFAAAAVGAAYQASQGQPWLVNALARECVEKILKNDSSGPVTEELITLAVENLILRRDTHLDSLLERLKEERVRKVVEPVLLGDTARLERLGDDFQYTLDLGLLKRERDEVKPSNPIYEEVIARTLNYDSQEDLPWEYREGWRGADGSLDMDGLLRAFQEFWRENAEVWVERYQYKEAAPHLILQAFLQRVVNGGGRIDREFATGRRRVDLCVRWPVGGEEKKYPIELKLYRSGKTEAEGVEQLLNYMEILDAAEGWLVIFDRRPEVGWEKKIGWKETERNGRKMSIVGC